MRKQFDIKYRPQIESGEYKVETKAGCPVRIVCWDMACELPILGLVLLNDEKVEEIAVGFTNEGTNLLGEPLYDKLFIVTPEEELSEFEKELESFYNRHLQVCTYDNQGTVEDNLHYWADRLLEIARDEIVKRGYVIKKKFFHNAVKKVDLEVMKDVSESIDKIILTPFEQSLKDRFFFGEFAIPDSEIKEIAAELLPLARKQLQPEIDAAIEKAYKNADEVQYKKGWEDAIDNHREALHAEYEKGRAEALKDLPRWKKIGRGNNYLSETKFTINGRYLEMNDVSNDVYEVALSKLEKLQKDNSHE